MHLKSQCERLKDIRRALIQKRYNQEAILYATCYGCTVHKVQGMPTDAAAIGLENTFAAGMAYMLH